MYQSFSIRCTTISTVPKNSDTGDEWVVSFKSPLLFRKDVNKKSYDLDLSCDCIAWAVEE